MKPQVSSVTDGGSITYNVVIKNKGTSTCRDVSYSFFYANNEKFTSSNPLPRASDYYWYLGNLAAGKTITGTVNTKHTGRGDFIVSEGCASARNGIDACASETIRVVTSLINVGTSTIPVIITPTSTPQTTDSKEKGMWVWKFPSQMNTATGQAEMNTLAGYGFNVVYITIDDYLDIAILPEGTTKQSLKTKYFAQLALFVQKANALGIAVDAEGGANNWSMQANRWKGFALIDAMKEYNTLYPTAKVRGFQYDVEPHTLADYETNKTTRLKEYVAFVDESMARVAGSNVRLSIVIPHFFDDAQAWTPSFAYNGTTTHAFNHLLTIMDKKAGSSILLMSYRNFFDGPNGTKEISKIEVEKASTGNHSTKVIVGQETGNVDPAFITFYGKTKQELFNALQASDDVFGVYAGYGGTASHYLDSFLDMR